MIGSEKTFRRFDIQQRTYLVVESHFSIRQPAVGQYQTVGQLLRCLAKHRAGKFRRIACLVIGQEDSSAVGIAFVGYIEPM